MLTNTNTKIIFNDKLKLLFNLIMKKIIDNVKNAGHGYKLNTGSIKIICYADEAVIISEEEDDLQRMLHSFYLTAK